MAMLKSSSTCESQMALHFQVVLTLLPIRDRTHLAVVKAELVNILEDHLETLHFYPLDGKGKATSDLGDEDNPHAGDNVYVQLNLRGYEVQTVRLTVKSKKSKAEPEGWIKL